MTCFCPTRNRRAWLPSAIRCFLLQTYANAELLIVADGEERVDDLVPFNDPRITLITVPHVPYPADKFNLACSYAKSEILIKWDDDDFSAPNRIADQVHLMERSGKAVVGYHSMLFHDGSDWWRYTHAPNWCFGTSLCFTRAWWQKSPFVSEVTRGGVTVRQGSDNIFCGKAAIAGQVCSIDAGSTMVASIHGGNTSPRSLNCDPWVKVKGQVEIPGYEWPLKEKVAA